MNFKNIILRKIVTEDIHNEPFMLSLEIGRTSVHIAKTYKNREINRKDK